MFWMPNLRSFLRSLFAFGSTVPASIVRQALWEDTMNAYRVAVMTTPRDTGYAQYNWQGTEGGLPSGFIGGKRDPNKSYPIRDAREVVGGRLAQNPFTVTHISNYAPYIQVLNDGIGENRRPFRMAEQARDAAMRTISLYGVATFVRGKL